MVQKVSSYGIRHHKLLPLFDTDDIMKKVDNETMAARSRNLESSRFLSVGVAFQEKIAKNQ
jgi:hypothetical protein